MGKKAIYIKFLVSGFGNSVGDIVRLVLETSGYVYYYDNFRRYCYMNKSECGTSYEYVEKPNTDQKNGGNIVT